MFYVWLLTENPSGSEAPGDAKFVIKSSTFRVLVKKPASDDSNSARLGVNKQGAGTTSTSALQGVASNGSNPAKPNDDTQEHKTIDTGIGLQSLCQNYESDDD